MGKKTKNEVVSADAKAAIDSPSNDTYSIMLKGYGARSSNRQIQSPAASDTVPRDEQIFAKNLLSHPWPQLPLLEWSEQSDILSANIQAAVRGVWGYGWEASSGTTEMSDDEKPRYKEEKRKIEDFFHNCNQNYTWDYILQEQFGPWYYATGNGYFAITRDLGGKIRGITCLPPHLTFATEEEKNPVFVQTTVVDWETGKEEIIEKLPRRFRRYALFRNGKYTWYKQYGDDRIYDMRTGEENPKCPFKYRAQEILHIANACSWSHPYGVPIWLGSLFGISTSRDGEIVNQEMLQNGCMPIVVVCVSGGHLTAESIAYIKNLFSGSGGPRNYYRLLTLEAMPFAKESLNYTAASGEGSLKIDIKAFPQVVPQDALFLKLKQATNDYVTGCFRHSKNATGLYFSNVTGEELQALMARDEVQVYQPQRELFDGTINKFLVEMEIGAKVYRYKTKAPRIRDARIQAQIVESIARTGVISRSDIAPMLRDVLDCPVPVGEEWYNHVPAPIIPTMLQTGNFPGGTPVNAQQNETQTGHTQGAIGKNKPATEVSAQPMSDNTALQNLRKSYGEQVLSENPDLCQVLVIDPNGNVGVSSRE